MPGVGRAQGGGSGGARIGPGPKPKPGAKKRIRNKKAMAQAAASAAAAALVEKSSPPAVGHIYAAAAASHGRTVCSHSQSGIRACVSGSACSKGEDSSNGGEGGWEEDARHILLTFFKPQPQKAEARARVSLLSAHTRKRGM